MRKYTIKIIFNDSTNICIDCDEFIKGSLDYIVIADGYKIFHAPF